MLIGVVALIGVCMVPVARLRRGFDAMVEPADDLKRADDGHRPTLAERDGTGGFL